MGKIVFKEVKKTKTIRSFEDFARENIENYRDYLAVKVDGIVEKLDQEIYENSEVEFLSVKDVWGYRAYTRTLNLIFLKAFYKLFPNNQADLNHYLGAGMYIDFDQGFYLDRDKLELLESEMKKLIGEDHKIETRTYEIDEALELFEDNDQEVVRLLKTLKKDRVEIVNLDGYLDINYSILAPSSSYIKEFRIMQYYPGVLLIAPTHRNNYDISKYKEMPKLAKVFQDSTERFKRLGLNQLYSINEIIQAGEEATMMKISESIFDKTIIDIAEDISKNNDIKIILISGPTSSGKTTFTNRLKILLKSMEINPIMISMDDYFVDRDKTPLDENGDLDFESPYAVDLTLFNDDMNKLMNGEKIYRRTFDFLEGKGTYSDDEILPGEHSPILIEGIHALNPLLSQLIPEKNKYKIYVSALNQVNLDSHNRVSTTDSRFFRRAVRDNNFRGYGIEETFKLWENVGLAEDKYIFPYQENADVIVNTSLPYETAILKKHILPMLETIGRDSKYYNEARKMRNILSFFESIEDDSLVSSESLLREFIGD